MGYGTAVEMYHYFGGTSEDEGSRFLVNVSTTMHGITFQTQALLNVQLILTC
jgi:hypothetical protein